MATAVQGKCDGCGGRGATATLTHKCVPRRAVETTRDVTAVKAAGATTVAVRVAAAAHVTVARAAVTAACNSDLKLRACQGVVDVSGLQVHGGVAAKVADGLRSQPPRAAAVHRCRCAAQAGRGRGEPLVVPQVVQQQNNVARDDGAAATAALTLVACDGDNGAEVPAVPRCSVGETWMDRGRGTIDNAEAARRLTLTHGVAARALPAGYWRLQTLGTRQRLTDASVLELRDLQRLVVSTRVVGAAPRAKCVAVACTHSSAWEAPL